MGSQMTTVEPQVESLRMNETASEIVESMVDQADLLRVRASRLRKRCPDHRCGSGD